MQSSLVMYPKYSENPFALLHFSSDIVPSPEIFCPEFSEIITTSVHQEVKGCIERLMSAQKKGQHAIGFIAYEAAPSFDESFCTSPPNPDIPLLWFGVFDQINSFDQQQEEGADYIASNWKPSLEEQEYEELFHRVKEDLRNGDTYQLNLSFPLHARFQGDIRAYYHHLRKCQSASYSALIHTETCDILSLSPELFFAYRHHFLTTKPMKGTRNRGVCAAEDQRIAQELASNSKDRAENIMIVDLLRNDLGRIAKPGSVQVEKLFSTELYPTVIQMVSTVTAECKEGINLFHILKALFPCGSITGVPKIKTMEKITMYEKHPRGVYCGSIGYLGPTGSVFNVAIRTMIIKSGAAVYSVGSGLVIDSEAKKEYQECLLKSNILKSSRSFQLLETMLFDPKTGFYLLTEHLQRLEDSAVYFHIPYSPQKVKERLHRASESWTCMLKVRLLLSWSGSISLETFPLKKGAGELHPLVELKLAKQPVNRCNPFLYHKTTNRSVYTTASREDADDVVLYNQQNEITETTIANIAIYIQGEWVTPPISCGLLPGTKRKELLKKGDIKEGIVKKNDLTGEMVMLFNSVRGVYRGRMI